MAKPIFGNLLQTGAAVTFVAAAFFAASASQADDYGSSSLQTHTVVIEKFKFVPSELSVSVGDTVQWINRDIAPHTATSKTNDWDSARLDQSDVWSVVITADMAQDYFCRYHPQMKARLNIEK